MQVQKYNGYQNPNFGTAVPITTTNPEIAIKLVRLGDLLHSTAHPQFRYLHLGCDIEDGFRGIIGDKDHKEVIAGIQTLSLGNRLRQGMIGHFKQVVDQEGNQPQNITKLTDLLNLQIFANCREAIAEVLTRLG